MKTDQSQEMHVQRKNEQGIQMYIAFFSVT